MQSRAQRSRQQKMRPVRAGSDPARRRRDAVFTSLRALISAHHPLLTVIGIVEITDCTQQQKKSGSASQRNCQHSSRCCCAVQVDSCRVWLPRAPRQSADCSHQSQSLLASVAQVAVSSVVTDTEPRILSNVAALKLGDAMSRNLRPVRV